MVFKLFGSTASNFNKNNNGSCTNNDNNKINKFTLCNVTLFHHKVSFFFFTFYFAFEVLLVMEFGETLGALAPSPECYQTFLESYNSLLHLWNTIIVVSVYGFYFNTIKLLMGRLLVLVYIQW